MRIKKQIIYIRSTRGCSFLMTKRGDAMADMLVELIQKFIDGSEATLNSLFKSMVNLVFFIERELNAIQVDGGTKIDFNGIYQVIFSYACNIMVFTRNYIR